MQHELHAPLVPLNAAQPGHRAHAVQSLRMNFIQILPLREHYHAMLG
jgi:hypothetical protein